MPCPRKHNASKPPSRRSHDARKILLLPAPAEQQVVSPLSNSCAARWRGAGRSARPRRLMMPPWPNFPRPGRSALRSRLDGLERSPLTPFFAHPAAGLDHRVPVFDEIDPSIQCPRPGRCRGDHPIRSDAPNPMPSLPSPSQDDLKSPDPHEPSEERRNRTQAHPATNPRHHGLWTVTRLPGAGDRLGTARIPASRGRPQPATKPPWTNAAAPLRSAAAVCPQPLGQTCASVDAASCIDRAPVSPHCPQTRRPRVSSFLFLPSSLTGRTNSEPAIHRSTERSITSEFICIVLLITALRTGTRCINHGEK